VCIDLEAAELVAEYHQILKNASGKAWNRYRPTGQAPFDSGDLDSYALEGLMIIAGMLPGSNHGKLAEYEGLSASERDRYIQHAIDLHVGMRCGHDLERLHAQKRGGGSLPLSLDASVTGDGEVTLEAPQGVGTSDVALPAVSKRYPVLSLTELEGFTDAQAREHLGVDGLEYRRQRDGEVQDLFAWATRNRRIKPGWRLPEAPETCGREMRGTGKPCARAPLHKGKCASPETVEKNREANRAWMQAKRAAA